MIWWLFVIWELTLWHVDLEKANMVFIGHVRFDFKTPPTYTNIGLQLHNDLVTPPTYTNIGLQLPNGLVTPPTYKNKVYLPNGIVCCGMQWPDKLCQHCRCMVVWGTTVSIRWKAIYSLRCSWSSKANCWHCYIYCPLHNKVHKHCEQGWSASFWLNSLYSSRFCTASTADRAWL